MTELFKVIGVDNHARETVADKLIISHLPETADDEIAAILNNHIGVRGSEPGTYYKSVSLDYKLNKGMEEHL